jgi:hypothetical protein
LAVSKSNIGADLLSAFFEEEEDDDDEVVFFLVGVVAVSSPVEDFLIFRRTGNVAASSAPILEDFFLTGSKLLDRVRVLVDDDDDSVAAALLSPVRPEDLDRIRLFVVDASSSPVEDFFLTGSKLLDRERVFVDDDSDEAEARSPVRPEDLDRTRFFVVDVSSSPDAALDFVLVDFFFLLGVAAIEK